MSTLTERMRVQALAPTKAFFSQKDFPQNPGHIRKKLLIFISLVSLMNLKKRCFLDFSDFGTFCVNFASSRRPLARLSAWKKSRRESLSKSRILEFGSGKSLLREEESFFVAKKMSLEVKGYSKSRIIGAPVDCSRLALLFGKILLNFKTEVCQFRLSYQLTLNGPNPRDINFEIPMQIPSFLSWHSCRQKRDVVCTILIFNSRPL